MNLSNSHIPPISWTLLGLISFFIFLFLGRDAFHGSEAYLAEKAREMLITGDYFHSYNNFCLQGYTSLINTWLILPLQKFLEPSEFIIRLPGAIFALSSIAGIIVLGKQLYSNRSALLASWMFISTYGFIISARTASFDSVSLSASLWALVTYFYNEEQRNFFKSLLFWILIFLCAASSNLIPAIITLAILLPRIIRKKCFFSSIFSIRNILAFFLGSLIFITPLILHYGFDEEYNTKFSLETFKDINFILDIIKQNLTEILNYFKHINLNYYFNKNIFSIFRILLPWAPLIFVSTYYILAKKSKYPNITFDLLKGSLLGWLIFILSAQNHWDFCVLLLPIIILPTAQFLDSFEEEFTTKNKYPKLLSIIIDIYYYLAIFISAVFLSSIFMISLWHSFLGTTLPKMPLFSVPIAGAITLFVIRLDWQEAPNPLTILSSIPRKLSAIFIGYSLLMITTWSVLLPGLTELRTKKTFFISLHEKLKNYESNDIYFFNTTVEPAFLYYLDIEEPVFSSNCPNTHKRSLKDFISENRGKNIVIVCNDKPITLSYLDAELKKLKITNKDISLKEEPIIGKNIIHKKNQKWRAYFITVPKEDSSK